MEPKEYILVKDRSKENPPKFIIGEISIKERMGLIYKIENNTDPYVYYDIVKKGLRGIKQFRSGNEEAKDISVIDDVVMGMLQPKDIKELFIELVNINFLSETDQKN